MIHTERQTHIKNFHTHTETGDRFTLPRVEQLFYDAVAIDTSTEETINVGLQTVFSPAFLDQDAYLAGNAMAKKVQDALFPDKNSQLFVPTPDEWRQSLVAVTTRAAACATTHFTDRDEKITAQSKVADIIVQLVGLENPNVDPGVTKQGGITFGERSEFTPLKNRAHRGRFIIEVAKGLSTFEEEEEYTVFDSENIAAD